MNMDMWVIIAFVVVIAFHELGHYLAFRVYGIHPKIHIRWWGLMVGDEDTSFKRLTVKQYYHVLNSGIWSGFLFFIPFYLTIQGFSTLLMIIYIICCVGDISQMYMMMQFKKESRKLLLGQAYIEYLEMRLDEMKGKMS